MCLLRKPTIHNVFENPFTENDGTPVIFEYFQRHIAWPNRVGCFCKKSCLLASYNWRQSQQQEKKNFGCYNNQSYINQVSKALADKDWTQVCYKLLSLSWYSIFTFSKLLQSMGRTRLCSCWRQIRLTISLQFQSWISNLLQSHCTPLHLALARASSLGEKTGWRDSSGFSSYLRYSQGAVSKIWQFIVMLNLFNLSLLKSIWVSFYDICNTMFVYIQIFCD